MLLIHSACQDLCVCVCVCVSQVEGTGVLPVQEVISQAIEILSAKIELLATEVNAAAGQGY